MEERWRRRPCRASPCASSSTWAWRKRPRCCPSWAPGQEKTRQGGSLSALPCEETMRLDSICKQLRALDETLRVVNCRQVRITGVADDSRKVRKGEVFAALSGTKADGLQFVPAALAAGAK